MILRSSFIVGWGPTEYLPGLGFYNSEAVKLMLSWMCQSGVSVRRVLVRANDANAQVEFGTTNPRLFKARSQSCKRPSCVGAEKSEVTGHVG